MPRRPWVWLCLSFLAGILAAELSGVSPVFFGTAALLTWGAVGAVLLKKKGISTFSVFRRKCTYPLFFLVCILFAFLGAFRHSWVSHTLPADHLLFHTSHGERLTLEGRLLENPEPLPERPGRDPAWRLLLDTRLLTREREARFEPLTRNPVNPNVFRVPSEGANRAVTTSGRVSLVGPLAGPFPRRGDFVSVTAQIRSPRPPTNPGEFDFRRWLARQGVYRSGYFNDPDSVRLSSDPAPGLVSRIRRGAEDLLSRQYDGETLAMMRALLLGDRSLLDATSEDRFRETGTVHFLALSGLHLGILVGMVWCFCRVAGLREIPRCLLILLFVLFYLFLVGYRPSLLRAGLIAILYFAAPLARRPSDFLNALALSAFLILVWNPAELFSIGFQFSYLACLGIVYGEPLLRTAGVQPERWLYREAKGSDPVLRTVDPNVFRPQNGDRILERLFASAGLLLRVSLAAWLSIFPLAAHTFHTVSLAAVPGSVLLAPVVTGLLWSGFLGGLFGALWGPLGFLFTLPAQFLSSVLLRTVDFLSFLPGDHFYVAGAGGFWVILYYTLAVWILFRFASGSKPLLSTHLRTLCAAVLLLANLWIWPAVFRDAAAKPFVSFYDVGHGLAVAARTPEGRVILYDCGAYGGRDPGRSLLPGALWSEGITRIDDLFLSHPHLDHYSGLRSLARKFSIGRVWINGAFEESGGWRQVRSELERRGIPVSYVQAGDLRVGSRGSRIETLAPHRGRSTDGRLGWNDRSSVIRLSFPANRLRLSCGPVGLAAPAELPLSDGRFSILLTGDLEEVGASLLEQTANGDLSCTVLAVPHHGSHHPGAPRLLSLAAPRAAVNSARAGFSSPEWQSLSLTSGILFRETFRHGAVTFRF